jgi:putative membrane protein
MARRALILSIPPALIAPFVAGWWAFPVVLALTGVMILHARLQVPHMGWTFLQDGVAFRAGWLHRSTTAAPFKRVQCVEFSESPFDRRSGMATVAVDTAGASIRALGMSYLPRNAALHLRDVIAEHSAQTAFTW